MYIKRIMILTWGGAIAGLSYIAYTANNLRESAIALIIIGFLISHILTQYKKRYLSLRESIALRKEMHDNWWIIVIGILISLTGLIMLYFVSDIGFAEKSLGILLVCYLYSETLFVSEESASGLRELDLSQEAV